MKKLTIENGPARLEVQGFDDGSLYFRVVLDEEDRAIPLKSKHARKVIRYLTKMLEATK